MIFMISIMHFYLSLHLYVESKKIIMKKHSLSISIEEPCHENWLDMTPREKGRHCATCNKTVVDFTKMSKAGILNHISSNEEEVCGRFNSDQLNINLMPARKNRLFSKWAAVLIGLIPFAGYSQSPIHTNEFMENSIMGKRAMKMDNNKKLDLTSKKNIITGKLIDAETTKPILFATVAAIKDGIIIRGVETDINGTFTINIHETDALEFAYIGYGSIRKNVAELKSSQNSSLIIEMGMQGILLGDVVITSYKAGIIKGEMTTTGSYALVGGCGISESGESWLNRQWRKFKKLINKSHDAAVENKEKSRANHSIDPVASQHVESKELTSQYAGVIPQKANVINIYPNPSIGNVTVEMPEGLTNGLIYITNSTNQLIFSDIVDENRFQYNAADLIAGSYIISIISENKLVASEVFIKI